MVQYPRRNTTVLSEDASVLDVVFVFLSVFVFGFMSLVRCVFMYLRVLFVFFYWMNVSLPVLYYMLNIFRIKKPAYIQPEEFCSCRWYSMSLVRVV